MAIELIPAENGWVLVYRITGRWTVPDVIACFDDERAFREQAGHPVHLLVDMRHADNIPGKLFSIRSAPGINDHTGAYVVLLGVPPLGKTLGESIFRVFHFERWKFFDEEDAALAFLRARITLAQAQGESSDSNSAEV